MLSDLVCPEESWHCYPWIFKFGGKSRIESILQHQIWLVAFFCWMRTNFLSTQQDDVFVNRNKIAKICLTLRASHSFFRFTFWQTQGQQHCITIQVLIKNQQKYHKHSQHINMCCKLDKWRTNIPCEEVLILVYRVGANFHSASGILCLVFCLEMSSERCCNKGNKVNQLRGFW